MANSVRKVLRKLRFALQMEAAYLGGFRVRAANRGILKPIVVGSAHKVGSTWLVNLLLNTGLHRRCYALPGNYRANPSIAALLDLQAGGAVDYVRRRTPRVYKTHSLPDGIEPQDLQLVTVVRDPRDLVVSNIFYLESLPPAHGGWPELKTLPLEEKFKLYLQRGVFDCRLMEAWISFPGTQRVRFEDLKADAVGCLDQLYRALGYEVSRQRIKRAVQVCSFSRMSGGRRAGQSDMGSFFRKGIVGDWKNHFTPAVQEAFDALHDGRWRRLTEKLGYME